MVNGRLGGHGGPFHCSWADSTGPTGAVEFVAMSAEMTAGRFVAKWTRSDLPERAASQEHFIDLCRLLGQPTPAEYDATGAEYTFEKGVASLGWSINWVDVRSGNPNNLYWT